MAEPPVAGLLLAAGAGRRYGMPKALVPYGGQLLVERAAGALRAAGLDPVVVVLGAAAARVRASAVLDGCTVVDNPDWRSGMGSSLRTGLATLDGRAVDAALVLLVDTPNIGSAAVRRVAAAATAGGTAALAMAGYGERRGHPVLLGRDRWPEVARLAIGDVGARPYLHAHFSAVRVIGCGDIADDGDLDVPLS